MDNNLKKRCLEYGRHISSLLHIQTRLYDAADKSIISDDEDFCKNCCCIKCQFHQTHCYGCNEAYRWDGKYIYFCPMGLTFSAAVLTDTSGQLLGGLIAGPMVMGQLEDTLLELPEQSMEEAVRKLTVYKADEVNHLSEIFSVGVHAQSELANSVLIGSVYKQAQMLNTIYHVKNTSSDSSKYCYPIRYEKELQASILHKDSEGSEKLLQTILSHIFIACDFDISRIRIRAAELITLISRATIDTGADINEVFQLNNLYLERVQSCNSTEDISKELTEVLQYFLSCSFNFATAKHSDIVYRAMEYIREHYAEKISVSDVAEHVGLNKTYLSSIFKTETGMQLTNYINSVRVERSKSLLLNHSVSLAEVAVSCGFEDQSYFTKIFKRFTGVTPKHFRDARDKRFLADMKG